MIQTYEIRRGGNSERFVYRPVTDNFAAVSSDPSATITVYHPSGETLIDGAPMSWEGTNHYLYYDIDASDTAEWTSDLWYRAVIESSTLRREAIFSVCHNPYKPNVTTGDLEKFDAGVYYKTVNETDVVASDYIEQALVEIHTRFRNEFKISPGYLADKSHIDRCLILLSLYNLWFSESRSQDEPDFARQVTLWDRFTQAWEEMKTNLKIDYGQDGDNELDNDIERNLTNPRLYV